MSDVDRCVYVCVCVYVCHRHPLFVPRPTLVTALADCRCRCFSAGYAHSVALTDAGVYTWGSDDFGQLGLGSTPSHHEHRSVYDRATTWFISKVPIVGRIIAVDHHLPQFVAALEGQMGFRQVSAGMHHTVALSCLGQVFTWGLNSSGQLGLGDLVSRGLPQVVKRLWSKGRAIHSVSAGYYHTACISNYRRVYTWGLNISGQLGYMSTPVLSTPSRVKYFDDRKDTLTSVSCGRHVTAVLSSSRGQVFVFGCDPQQLMEKEGESVVTKIDDPRQQGIYATTNALRIIPREVQNVKEAKLISAGQNGILVWVEPDLKPDNS